MHKSSFYFENFKVIFEKSRDILQYQKPEVRIIIMEFQINEQLINIFILRQAQYDKDQNINSLSSTRCSLFDSSQLVLQGSLGESGFTHCGTRFKNPGSLIPSSVKPALYYFETFTREKKTIFRPLLFAIFC